MTAVRVLVALVSSWRRDLVPLFAAFACDVVDASRHNCTCPTPLLGESYDTISNHCNGGLLLYSYC